jgi:glucose/arabinose dehydrogenase
MQGLVWVAVAGFLSPSQTVSQVDLNEIITSVRVFPNLSFALPISLVQWPGDGERWLMAERGGQVFSFLNDDQVTDKQLVLDLTGRIGGAAFNESEQWGITGIALQTMPSMTPALPGEMALLVAYNAKVTEGDSATSFVSRFLSPDGGQTFDAASERILFEVPQRSRSHHLGQVVVGPDGYLYIGFGDGGEGLAAQDLNDLRGSILRVDVRANGADLYTIPSDNPLIGTGQREEIFTWGWRNPWRFSFDAMTGELWVGDVGDGEREEVTKAVPGRSHGWPYWEGTLCREPSCEGFDDVPPVLEYDHMSGTAVIGGYVYRGALLPELQGIYVFSDWNRGYQLWGVLYDGEGKGQLVTLGTIAAEAERPTSYAQDHQGELYHISAQDEAGIYKIVPKAP